MKTTDKTFRKMIKKECSTLFKPPPDSIYWLLGKKCFNLALKMCDDREKAVRTQIQKDLSKLFKPK